jgi:hypothetical protein
MQLDFSRTASARLHYRADSIAPRLAQVNAPIPRLLFPNPTHASLPNPMSRRAGHSNPVLPPSQTLALASSAPVTGWPTPLAYSGAAAVDLSTLAPLLLPAAAGTLFFPYQLSRHPLLPIHCILGVGSGGGAGALV